MLAHSLRSVLTQVIKENEVLCIYNLIFRVSGLTYGTQTNKHARKLTLIVAKWIYCVFMLSNFSELFSRTREIDLDACDA